MACALRLLVTPMPWLFRQVNIMCGIRLIGDSKC
ncbi:hypothetical protein LPU83_pLPU83c_0210 (plasmid) [Rhizobium favelukesii]|uniref:Uncharacterized protein n=1 Tax=Rhizobium favelukesii TaxID=348824 RepID=W6RHT9_9HYPH|nr:hypothetical protein LPU83_pLPU83c_0210 [Rhizobium favelukesii]